MNFIDAVKIAKEKKYLIGCTVRGIKDSRIDDIIICPTNPENFKLFEKKYIQTLSAEESIVSFMTEDVEIGVVFNRDLIRTQNLFICEPIEWVEENLDK